MTLLVAGADRVDAGKTTFSVGLLAHLRGRGAAPVGFKPRAGNDYWFDHDDYRTAAAEGRLYGKDAARLAAASAGDWTPEELNPIHRLWRPTPGRSGLLGERGRTFLVDRVTTPGGPLFAVNVEAKANGRLPDRVREALPLDGAVRVGDVGAFNDAMVEYHLPALRRLSEVVRRAETAVVESYGDIAVPLSDLDADAVAVVDPGRARVYDGGRYLDARSVVRGSPREGQLEERVGAVVELLDPVETVPLPALTSEERSDPSAVAEAYEPAYGALLEAAAARS
ncbi:ATPase [Halegenticoccus soli]|uniref:ATPase n=1 Tax=Halegenticoccus soli TaxID=1985678 RepID=UPI000C6EBD3B|nr:ATPase [Halegenticoccus soli]